MHMWSVDEFDMEIFQLIAKHHPANVEADVKLKTTQHIYLGLIEVGVPLEDIGGYMIYEILFEFRTFCAGQQGPTMKRGVMLIGGQLVEAYTLAFYDAVVRHYQWDLTAKEIWQRVYEDMKANGFDFAMDDLSLAESFYVYRGELVHAASTGIAGERISEDDVGAPLYRGDDGKWYLLNK